LRVLWKDEGEWTELGSFLTEWAAVFLVDAREDMRWLLTQLGAKPKTSLEHIQLRETRKRTQQEEEEAPAPARPHCECGDVLELFCCRCGQALCNRHCEWKEWADNPPAPRCFRGVGCSK